ncbi:MAG: prepilin-type N-terminal cleavage/methylation domain-containing protein [Chthoniobacterales bacterium]
MNSRGFTLLEVLIALGMFMLAVTGLALALDRAFSASILLRRDDEIRQQVESLVDQSMVLPIDTLQQGMESGPDALGVKYSTVAEPVEDLVNKDEETLGGIWKITVRAAWEEGSQEQEWKEEFLRYQP